MSLASHFAKPGLLTAMAAAVLVVMRDAAIAHAPNRSADISGQTVREALARHFHCRWQVHEDLNFNETFAVCKAGQRSSLDLRMSTDKHDRFSYVEFRAPTRLQYEGNTSVGEKNKNDIIVAQGRSDGHWLLDYFTPTWPYRASWLDQALDQTKHVTDFRSIKVGKLGVAVKSDGPADRDDTIVLLGITLGDPLQWRAPD